MEDCDNDPFWDIIMIFICLVILLYAATFGVDLYIKLRLYIENHGKNLANTKFFGLASTEGREGFASSLINLSSLKPDFPIYVDQLNNLFLGTGERDPYDALKAENTIKDWLNAGLINKSEARESLSFKTYLLYYPDDKYNPTNIPREEDRNTRIRRACKASLEYFASNKVKVYFVINGIDFKKFYEHYIPEKKNYLKPFTQSELNFLIRKYAEDNDSEIFKMIKFLTKEGEMRFPWNAGGVIAKLRKLVGLRSWREEYFNFYVEKIKKKREDTRLCMTPEDSIYRKLEQGSKKLRSVHKSLKKKLLSASCNAIIHSPVSKTEDNDSATGILDHVRNLEKILNKNYAKIDRDVQEVLDKWEELSKKITETMETDNMQQMEMDLIEIDILKVTNYMLNTFNSYL